MIIDFEKETFDALIQCDICIVGGGAIGLVIASELAKKGVDVVILEGGGKTLESKSQELHRGKSIGKEFSSIDVGRYRVLGGTTVYWAGQVIPFDRSITGGRSWLEHEPWPISEDELEKYFQRTYVILGLNVCELSDSKVREHMGFKDYEFGDHIDPIITRWVKIRNFSKLFGKHIKGNENLRVITHANVVAIQLNQSQDSVESVTIKTLTGQSAKVKAKRFILANGTMEISRLLLHPLADGTSAPWHKSNYLGSPFVDHIDCVTGTVGIIDNKKFHNHFDNIYIKGHKYYPILRLGTSTQYNEGLLDVSCHFLYKTRLTDHLENLRMFLRSIKDGGIPVKLISLPKHIAAVISTSIPLALRYFKDRRSFKPRDAEVSISLACEQIPISSSRITLGEETDALNMKRLNVDWQVDGKEMETMKIFTMFLKEELEKRGLANVTIDPLLMDLDNKFLANVHDAVHQMGATRIGANSETGFVDLNLKVFDIDNLYIAGATVFPSAGFANPTFTAIALALRLCDHLIKTKQ